MKNFIKTNWLKLIVILFSLIFLILYGVSVFIRYSEFMQDNYYQKKCSTIEILKESKAGNDIINNCYSRGYITQEFYNDLFKVVNDVKQ